MKLMLDIDCDEAELERLKDALKVMFGYGVMNIRDGSARLFFDDVGLVQKIVYTRRRRKREGENLVVMAPLAAGKAQAHFDKNGEMMLVEYETEWTRNIGDKSVAGVDKEDIIITTPTLT